MALMILSVTFDESCYSKRYDYAYNGNKKPRVGDKAIVHPYGEKKIVTIREIKSDTNAPYLKFITDVMTGPAYRKMARKQELGRELDRMLKTYRQSITINNVAQDNPVAAKLLLEYRQL